MRVMVQSSYKPGFAVNRAMWLIPTALSTLSLHHLPLKLTFFTLANGISSSVSKGRLYIIFVILLLVNLRICQVKMILKIFIVNSCGR